MTDSSHSCLLLNLMTRYTFPLFRFDLLEQVYGGYFTVYTVGLNQLSLLFPSPGLVNHDGAADLPDYFPGNVSLYDFILQNAHVKEATIKS